MKTPTLTLFAVITLFSGAAASALAGPGGNGRGAIISAAAHGAHGPQVGSHPTPGSHHGHGPRTGNHSSAGDHPGNGPHGPSHNGDAIAANITKNPELKTRLTNMLPSGMTLAEAANGFRNRGQFIAALNASNHFGIPFADLKHEMVDNHLSLGQAMKKLRGDTTSTTGDSDEDQGKPGRHDDDSGDDHD